MASLPTPTIALLALLTLVLAPMGRPGAALSGQGVLSNAPLSVRTLQPEGAPVLHVHQRQGPLVALRLSALVPSSFPEGAVELLQELARPDIEALADSVGARLVFTHEHGRALVRLTGPARELDALAASLLRVAGAPDVSAPSLLRARARAESRTLARLESPDQRVLRLLWRELVRAPRPSGSAVEALGPEALRRLADALYAPENVTLTAVGPAEEARLASTFRSWPSSGPTSARDLAQGERDGEPTVRARPRAHREWGAIGLPTRAAPAAVEVVAELVRERLPRAGLADAAVRTWRGPGGTVLVLSGALTAAGRDGGAAGQDAAGGGPATGIADALRAVVPSAAAVSDADVTRARQRVRYGLLLDARTVTGRAELIGRWAEREGDGAAAARLLRAVAEVEPEAVRRALEELVAGPVVVVEGDV